MIFTIDNYADKKFNITYLDTSEKSYYNFSVSLADTLNTVNSFNYTDFLENLLVLDHFDTSDIWTINNRQSNSAIDSYNFKYLDTIKNFVFTFIDSEFLFTEYIKQ